VKIKLSKNRSSTKRSVYFDWWWCGCGFWIGHPWNQRNWTNVQ